MTPNLEQRRKLFFPGAILIAGMILLGNIALVFFVQDEWSRIVLIDFTSPMVNLLATIAIFYAAKQSATRSRRLFLAWGVLALAQLSYTFGDTFWTILEVGLHLEPFPSIADGFYLSYYLLFLLGIRFLPTKRLSRVDWLKTTLDMSIVMLAAGLGYWNFLLGPLFISGMEEPLLKQILTLAYPIGDLVLLWAILTILYRRSGGHNRGPLLLLAAGAVVMIVTDSVFSYQSLIDTYVSGGAVDLGWIASYLLFGLAGVWQAANAQTSADPNQQLSIEPEYKDKLSTGLTYMPYLWLAPAYLLLAWSHDHPMPMSFSALVGWVAAVISLVLVRQMATLSENSHLYGQLKRAMKQIRQRTVELSKANQELQVEIAERKRAEEQLAYDALHDALTGLANRALFMDRLSHAIEYTKRRKDYCFSVLFLDLDHFKVINDSLGHIVGDQLLISFAQRLRMCSRMSDTVARLGGDEFVILLEDIKTDQDVISTAIRIQERLKMPFTLEGHKIFITASVGIVLDGREYDHPQDVLRDADIAMYHAKAHGKAHFEVFNANLRHQAFTRLELENDLRYALERQEFQLCYQPINLLNTNDIVGFEALLRWHHPQRGLVKPDEFIQLAEETGLIWPIGQWVLREACRQVREWQMKFPRNPPLSISVNISSIQLTQPDILEQIEQILQETGLNGNCLKLEITESVCLKSSESAMAVFTGLSEMGIQFHIDDFGTGYSSLSYLQHFPIHTIKIDRTFVGKMVNSSHNTEIVRTIIGLAHDLGLDAIAEGIETEEQLNILKELGCNYGQGYLLSFPINRAGIEKFLTHAESNSDARLIDSKSLRMGFAD